VIYCDPRDTDPTVRKKQKRVSGGRRRRRGSAALGINGAMIPAVFELRESDDGVQEETTKTMACRDRSFASCRREER
jgi:hypothetical protein